MLAPIYQVDAFTEMPFEGNPAAVVPLEVWPDDDALLQRIAAENNLSETAFYVPAADDADADFEIRWFTPRMEVDLCPSVPVPKPIFEGTVDGVYVAVANRVGGLSGTELTGDLKRTERMIASTGRVLEELLESSPTPITDALFDELVQARVDLAAARVRGRQTEHDLRRRADDLRRALVGRSIRLATYHADTRAKHVRVSPAGDVIGLLDWGASEERFLPFADLLQLVIHQREQEIAGTLGDAWRLVGQRTSRRAYEHGALVRYAHAADLDEDDIETFVAAFPLFVAGMSERTWDFSRPHWVSQQFGI